MNKTAPTRLLLCECAHAKTLPAEVRRAVRRGLDAAGVEYTVVADLCELSARKDPLLERLAAGGEVRVSACYPRAVRWLFAAGGAPLPDGRAKVFNLRTMTADEVARGLLAGAEALPRGEATRIDDQAGGWMPWFPVIDRERCTDCQQCLSFCLFGVFVVDDEGHVEVRNPSNCKTDCPACARVCPSVAIVFPKHDQSPINGDQVREGDVAGGPVKIDVSALLGGDLNESLRARNRQATERFSAARRPEDLKSIRLERLRAAQEELGIPDGALPTLPPMCDCQRRALEAQAKVAREREGKRTTEEEWGI